jgi:SSS family solute:Na+ symporter
VASLTLAILTVYLLAVAAFGFVYRRRAGASPEAFFVADRSLSTFWGFVGLASLTTGGSTTIVLASLVLAHGLSGLWLDLAGALGLLVLALTLARRVRREGAVTLPEILGRRYGMGARRVAAILVLASEIAWFALLVTAAQKVLTPALALPPGVAIVASTAVFVLYTAMGGHYAVARTDAVQYGLMLLAIPGIALVSALRAVSGAPALPAEVWSFPTSATVSASDIVAMLVLVGLPHLVGSDVWLKISSCRDEATARRATLLAAGSKLLFGLAVAAVALAARAALPPMPPEETLPRAVMAFAPPVLAALVLVALVATMQTSADVVLLSASAVTVRDLFPLPASTKPVAAARLLSVVYGGLGLAVAFALNASVLGALRLAYSIFAAGLILPSLTALAPPAFRVPPAGAITAMAMGGGVAAAGRIPGFLPGRLDPVLAGTGVCLCVLLVAWLLRRPGQAS